MGDGADDDGGTRKRLLLIGGGSGTGKTTVGWEVSEILKRRGTAHCVLEGDYMDQGPSGPAR
jgi:adenylylsulfate kinase-like enzyme